MMLGSMLERRRALIRKMRLTLNIVYLYAFAGGGPGKIMIYNRNIDGGRD